MNDNYLQFSQNTTVTVNDCDFMSRLKPSSVMAYFQDIATEHANHLAIGYDDMTNQNLVWVMSRMCFRIFRHPKIGEELTVKTYPEQPQTADVARGYYIFDKAGNKVISGSSRWCVLAKDTRRIQRCAPMFEGRNYNYIPFKPFEDANKKVEPFRIEGLKPVLELTVQPTDLDRNVHFNNTRYGDIILNVCGYDYIKNHSIQRLDVNFLAEAFVGDKLVAFAKRVDGGVAVEVLKQTQDKKEPVFRAVAEFSKI